jgi:hypothetical protein
MFRTTLLALAATAGLVGTTELGTSQAQADTHIRFGIYGGYRPSCYRPVIVPRVVVTTAASPVIYAPTTPVYVPVAYPAYDVLVRSSANGPWQLYATYPSYQAAQTIVPNLQSNGLWVMVEQH